MDIFLPPPPAEIKKVNFSWYFFTFSSDGHLNSQQSKNLKENLNFGFEVPKLKTIFEADILSHYSHPGDLSPLEMNKTTSHGEPWV